MLNLLLGAVETLNPPRAAPAGKKHITQKEKTFGSTQKIKQMKYTMQQHADGAVVAAATIVAPAVANPDHRRARAVAVLLPTTRAECLRPAAVATVARVRTADAGCLDLLA